MDPNKDESEREEAEEKIRGERKPACSRLEEGGRAVNRWARRGSEEESAESLMERDRMDVPRSHRSISDSSP